MHNRSPKKAGMDQELVSRWIQRWVNNGHEWTLLLTASGLEGLRGFNPPWMSVGFEMTQRTSSAQWPCCRPQPPPNDPLGGVSRFPLRVRHELGPPPPSGVRKLHIKLFLKTHPLRSKPASSPIHTPICDDCSCKRDMIWAVRET
jgi:hypothetical protein